LGIVFALWALACGDGDGTTPADAASNEPCASDEHCSDSVFCNGVERCMAGDPTADARGCVAGAVVECVTGQTCSEELDRCVTTDCTVGRDLDMDGVEAVECGGFDCDDSDRSRAPGNTEFCDVMDHDEDCDPMTFGVRDGDMDGFADAACCNLDGELRRVCGRDCDDTRATANPTTAETCNGLDDDCDDSIDEGVQTLYTIDADRDLHGSDAMGAATTLACSMPAGYAERSDDCDDMDSGRNPSVGERCDRPVPPSTESIDDDCDGMINEGCTCDSGETRPCPLPGRCAAGTETCVEGVWSDMCSIAPMTEICNGEDDDCSGAVDEGLTVDCYPDADDDMHAALAATAAPQCRDPDRPDVGFCPPFYTNLAPTITRHDCEPSDADTYPGAPELCDGRDQDCSPTSGVPGTEPGEDFDGDHHTSPSYTRCMGGFPKDDCQDTDDRVFFMQPMFFDTPSCAAGRVRCDECCTIGAPCPGQCIEATDLCAPEVLGGCRTMVAPTSFDFDCDGMTEREPVGSACLDAGATCGHPGATCGTGGAIYRGSPPCGSMIDEHQCTCDFEGMACAPQVTMRPLRCR
jgi:hypothetical protein